MARAELAVLLALCVLPIALAEPVVYGDCGSQVGNLVSVDVSPCPKKPCRLARGSSYTIKVAFTSNVNTGKLTAVVDGYIFNVALPVSIPETDGCKSGISCPVKKGKSYSYITTLPILSTYPKVSLMLRWQLLDAKQQKLFCWDLPVRIISG